MDIKRKDISTCRVFNDPNCAVIQFSHSCIAAVELAIIKSINNIYGYTF